MWSVSKLKRFFIWSSEPLDLQKGVQASRQIQTWETSPILHLPYFVRYFKFLNSLWVIVMIKNIINYLGTILRYFSSGLSCHCLNFKKFEHTFIKTLLHNHNLIRIFILQRGGLVCLAILGGSCLHSGGSLRPRVLPQRTSRKMINF